MEVKKLLNGEELKKRIQDIEDKGDWHLHPICEEFREVIDEAKKELPFKELPDFDRFVNVRFTVKETRELIKWFKKWVF